jgi:hypothetical protein
MVGGNIPCDCCFSHDLALLDFLSLAKWSYELNLYSVDQFSDAIQNNGCGDLH